MIANRRRRAPWLLLALVMGACGGNGDASFTPSEPAGAVVDQILDGDSLAVLIEGERAEVRLLGINAPERGECYDQEAKQALTGLLDTDGVVLIGDDTDRFGRILAYVGAADGTDVNLELLKSGAALALSTEHSRRAEFKAAEEEAYTQQIGRWRPGACGRPVNAPDVRIAAVTEDAPGDDGFNRNGEWVRVVNDGEAAVDLSGWGLADESSQHRFTFPFGAVLEPSGSFRVYSGTGEDGGGDYYWDAADAVWSNRGDTAYLSDPAGNVVSRYAY